MLSAKNCKVKVIQITVSGYTKKFSTFYELCLCYNSIMHLSVVKNTFWINGFTSLFWINYVLDVQLRWWIWVVFKISGFWRCLCAFMLEIIINWFLCNLRLIVLSNVTCFKSITINSNVNIHTLGSGLAKNCLGRQMICKHNLCMNLRNNWNKYKFCLTNLLNCGECINFNIHIQNRKYILKRRLIHNYNFNIDDHH